MASKYTNKQKKFMKSDPKGFAGKIGLKIPSNMEVEFHTYEDGIEFFIIPHIQTNISQEELQGINAGVGVGSVASMSSGSTLSSFSTETGYTISSLSSASTIGCLGTVSSAKVKH